MADGLKTFIKYSRILVVVLLVSLTIAGISYSGSINTAYTFAFSDYIAKKTSKENLNNIKACKIGNISNGVFNIVFPLIIVFGLFIDKIAHSLRVSAELVNQYFWMLIATYYIITALNDNYFGNYSQCYSLSTPTLQHFKSVKSSVYALRAMSIMTVIAIILFFSLILINFILGGD